MAEPRAGEDMGGRRGEPRPRGGRERYGGGGGGPPRERVRERSGERWELSFTSSSFISKITPAFTSELQPRFNEVQQVENPQMDR